MATEFAADPDSATIDSVYSPADYPLTADPDASHWMAVAGVTADCGRWGEPTPNHHTEIRSRWTQRNLYLLFICHYEELYSTPNPSTTTETSSLWEWDVAEAFIGADFENINRYAEFQVSPHGEWVDLAIDRGADPPAHDLLWNSGFEVRARIDERHRIWYGEMRIPIAAIDPRPPQAGHELRINFYRLQGPPAARRYIAWQPTHTDTYHEPAAFGRLRMVR